MALSVAQFGGLFRLITSDRARSATLGRAVVALATGLPGVFRLCLATVAAALALLAPLLLCIAFLYTQFLRQYDINYYLSARPPEWYRALFLATPFAIAWAIAAIWLVVRFLPALPAFFDGRRPAAAFGWRLSRRRFRTLFMRLGVAALTVVATRAALGATWFFAASTIVDRIAVASTSVRPLIVATAITGTLGGALDVIITFLGFAWLSAVLTQFYLEAADEQSRPGTLLRPVAATAWLTGRRVALIAAAALMVNAVASLTSLERSSQPPDFSSSRIGPVRGTRRKIRSSRSSGRLPRRPITRKSTCSERRTAWWSSSTMPT